MPALESNRLANVSVTGTTQKIDIAFTPDPDDAFAWWAILTGQIGMPGFNFSGRPLHIHDINQMCQRQELAVGAISSAAWPALHRNYRILSAGASVGRGYGPALVSLTAGEALPRGARVGIPGNQTTGAMLLKLYFDDIQTIEMPFDQILGAVLRKEIDAGVLIHEELLNWRPAGLHRTACLGAKWKADTGLPIPVGLVVMHARYGDETIRTFSSLVRQSMLVAMRRNEEARAWALQYSHEAETGIADQFMSMFANDDTLAMDSDCVRSLQLFYQRCFARGFQTECPNVTIF